MDRFTPRLFDRNYSYIDNTSVGRSCIYDIIKRCLEHNLGCKKRVKAWQVMVV